MLDVDEVVVDVEGTPLALAGAIPTGEAVF
jgi:hypothetical protein